jgi:hypothetical protein
MTTQQLDQIIEECPADVAVVLGDLHQQIREAAAEALAASQESDGGGKPKVKVALSLTIDLSTAPCSWVVGGGVSISYKVLGAEHRCDDPTQPSLPGVEPKRKGGEK